jgi:hypothetical protein
MDEQGSDTSTRSASRRTFLKTAAAAAGATLSLSGAATPGAAAQYPGLSQLRQQHERAGMISPGKTYRTMEWEFHTPPEEHFNINLDGAMRAARDAGAEAMMLYTQDHWGYAYYLSDVAVRHPHLDRDVFGTEVQLARQIGMSITSYYSLQFNNQCVITHPDWGWVDEHGKIQRWGDGGEGAEQQLRWYIPCLDTPYRQYVLAMVNELYSRYEIDELFLDIFGIQFLRYQFSGRSPFCFCKYTEDAWNRDHPGDAYRPGFNTTEGWERRYKWHQKRTMTDMLDEIMAAARKHRPNLLISLNGGPESFPDDIMRRVSYIYAESIMSRTGIALGAILLRGFGRPDYQAGVFSRQGYLDTYPGSIPRVQTDALIVQNARTFIVGNAPVVSDLDGQGFSKRWFAVAKETWQDVRNVDTLLAGGEPVLSTAVLYSNSTRELLDASKRPQDFRSSNVGALEALTYAGRPLESLAEYRLPAELEKFEALVLPEVEVLSDAQAEVIRGWVRNGGTLIANYRCGLLDENRRARSNFALADVFGVDYESEERRFAYDAKGKLRSGDFTSTYLESSGHPLAATLVVSTVGMPGSFLRLKRRSAEEVMHYRLPFMVQDLAHNHWFNWGPPPPGTETAGIAAALNRFGKGQSLYLGVPIFWAMQFRSFWIRQWLPELMRQLVTEPVAELRPEPFSEYVHGTFFYRPDRDFLVVQVLNTFELATESEYRPIDRVKLSVDPKRLAVKGARVVWPDERELEVRSAGGRTEIVVENPCRYATVLLKL